MRIPSIWESISLIFVVFRRFVLEELSTDCDRRYQAPLQHPIVHLYRRQLLSHCPGKYHAVDAISTRPNPWLNWWLHPTKQNFFHCSARASVRKFRKFFVSTCVCSICCCPFWLLVGVLEVPSSLAPSDTNKSPKLRVPGTPGRPPKKMTTQVLLHGQHFSNWSNQNIFTLIKL